MIPEDIITEIKRRADLAGVIGRTVKLKRSGRNLVGLCPFHNEKTPSFNVRPDEGFFYCFGCKAAGDVVAFLERTTGRGFLDIISELAEQTGIELPKQAVDPVEEERQKEKKRVLRALELAQVFFRTRLQSDEGKTARAYLEDVRKIDEASIDQFGLGFGGARDDGLATFLKEQGVSADDGALAGVLGKNERGAYDFFRHRATVPIRNLRGQVVSFQGRIFGERELLPDGSKRPKYVNGPQSPVYDKGAVLFGLFEALPALKQKTPAVLVEGPLDAIAIHRAGVATSVAPCGTGLTPRHVDELAQKTERVVICMDADKAGKDAAARAILMFLQRGLDVGLVALPDKDPDALVQAGRVDELRGLLLGAPSAIDALLARAREKATGNVRARVAALDEILPFLAAPSRDLVRSEGIRAVARAFNEDPAMLTADVDKRGRKLLAERLRTVPGRAPPPAAARPAAASATAQPRPQGQGASGAVTSSSGAQPPDDEARGGSSAALVPAVRKRAVRPARPLSEPEIMLIEALLTHPHLAARCGVLVPALRNVELREFVERLLAMLVRFHDEDPRDILPRVTTRPSGQINGVILKVGQSAGIEQPVAGSGMWRFARPDAYLPESAAARIVEDAILTLDKRVLEVRVGELQRLLAEADERDDHGERKRILAEQAALVEALKALASPQGHKPLSKRQIAVQIEKVVEAVTTLSGPPASDGAAADETAPPVDAGPEDLGQPNDEQEPAAAAASDADDAPWAGDPDDDPWAV